MLLLISHVYERFNKKFRYRYHLFRSDSEIRFCLDSDPQSDPVFSKFYSKMNIFPSTVITGPVFKQMNLEKGTSKAN